MGERSDTYKSDEEKAIERIAGSRYERESSPFETDATARTRYEQIVSDVKAEFVLMNGRIPRGGLTNDIN